MSTISKVSAKEHESYAILTIIGVLFPVIGIILGIVYLTKDSKLDRKLGEHLLAISILFMIIWFTLWNVWTAQATQVTPIAIPSYYQ